MNLTFSSVVFENEHFIAVDKKSGVLSVPSRMGKDDARLVLGLELQKQKQKQIFPVHRLDFEVSGIVIFALSPQSHKWANSAFESKKIQKTYHALSEKKSDEDFRDFSIEQNWRSLLVRGKKRTFEASYGQEALTNARVLKVLPKTEDLPETWLWELHPLTGKSHQLRVEMAKHEAPIVGDALYGSKVAYGISAIALRAVTVDFLQLEGREKWSLPDRLQVPGWG